jgi:uncharacterized protein YndB with AHSA1/START domain
VGSGDAAVFRALADPTRRALLDALFARDGQSLGELEASFDTSRFAVAKHLRVLADAGLVAVRPNGRQRLHFLDAVPIRLVHDRWISKYAEPWVAGLSDLKHALEATVEKVYEIYIKASPERLWEAITDPEQRARYTFGAYPVGLLAVGESLELRAGADGELLLGTGTYREVDPPRRLVHTMVSLFSDEAAAEPESLVSWGITPVGDSCHLVVTHSGLREGGSVQIYGGWPMILSGLKTWVESGELLTTPGSLAHT